MPSWFGVLEPYHPETLYRHVKELERVYEQLDPSDTNAREAVAKAIVSATASFVEGCLAEWIRQLRGDSADKQTTDVAKKEPSGLHNKAQRARAGWCVEPPIEHFIETDLKNLRNAVDHGDKVQQADLRLDAITEFKWSAGKYVEQVCTSLGIDRPGWLE